ncbi:MAG: PEP-CTERM sorting domain-containing protein [Gemmatimonadetes bacterium]|nr:PEP-CTERM sorting domain-containing protein [Gemmatimonadota bacterium]
MIRNIHRLFIATALVASTGTASAQRVSLTLDGIYRYTGNAPSPTASFRLSFELDRSPAVCGGGTGAVLVCGVTSVRYLNGPLDVMLATAEAPSVLLFDGGQGGGFALYQNDLGLNRLGFKIGAAMLFAGGLGAPTLVDGVYAVAPSEHCFWWTGCNYASYAGQSFASGDPVHDPFQDPESLQSYDPLESGTITIRDASGVSTVPEPTTLLLMPAGLAAVLLVRRRGAR